MAARNGHQVLSNGHSPVVPVNGRLSTDEDSSVAEPEPDQSLPYNPDTNYIEYSRLEEWCTRKRITSKAIRAMMSDSAATYVCCLRKPNQYLNFDRATNIEAMLIQMVGETRIPRACGPCQKKRGPFATCRTFQGVGRNACGNCHYGSGGTRCDFHQNDKDVIPFAAPRGSPTRRRPSAVEGAMDSPDVSRQLRSSADGSGLGPNKRKRARMDVEEEEDEDEDEEPDVLGSESRGRSQHRSSIAASKPASKQRRVNERTAPTAASVAHHIDESAQQQAPSRPVSRRPRYRMIEVPVPASLTEQEARKLAKILRAAAEAIEDDATEFAQ